MCSQLAGQRDPLLTPSSLIARLRKSTELLLELGEDFSERQCEDMLRELVLFEIRLNSAADTTRRLRETAAYVAGCDCAECTGRVIDLARQRSARGADGPSKHHDSHQLHLMADHKKAAGDKPQCQS